MGSSAAINEIGTILGLIITEQWDQETRISGISCPQISFDSPYELVRRSVAGQHVSIYLYQVNENSHLRSSDGRQDIDPGTGSERRRNPPLALDLLYLITAISNTNSAEDPTNEKLILGRVMQIFNDNREIPNKFFSNELQPLKDSRVKIYFHNLSMDDLTKIWTSFHETPYRLSVAYLVTPVFIDSIRYEILPGRVIDTKIAAAQVVKKEDE